MRRPERIEQAVAKLRRVSDEQLASQSQSPAAQALFEEVTSMDRDPQSTLVTVRPHRRRRRLVLAAAAAAVAAAAVFGVSLALRQAPPAGAAVQFRSSGGFIVATVQDPYAGAQQRLDAAFAAHDLDIHLKLVPVSPSMVGSVVYMGSSAGAGDIGVLYSRTRQAPGGPLPVGLRIPVDFKGQADIVLGRAARAGETYVSAGDAFAPREALHGSGLVGMRVSAAVVKLRELGLTAEWRDKKAAPAGAAPQPVPSPTAQARRRRPPPALQARRLPRLRRRRGHLAGRDPGSIPDNWVTGAVPLAAGKVLIFTQAQRPATR